MCTQVVSGLACRGQRTSDPPELELQACEMLDMGVCGGNCLLQEQYAHYTAEPLLQFFFFFKVKKYMHLYIMYMCPLRPERTLDPLKLELHAVVSPTWALETEKNSKRRCSSLSHLSGPSFLLRFSCSGADRRAPPGWASSPDLKDFKK